MSNQLLCCRQSPLIRTGVVSLEEYLIAMCKSSLQVRQSYRPRGSTLIYTSDVTELQEAII